MNRQKRESANLIYVKNKRMKESEQSLRNLWDTVKHTYLCIMESQKGERAKGAKRPFKEIMAEKIPNLVKDMDLHIQEAQCTPSMTYSKDIHNETHYNQAFESQR